MSADVHSNLPASTHEEGRHTGRFMSENLAETVPKGGYTDELYDQQAFRDQGR